MPLGIQYIGVLFGLLLLYQSFFHFKRKEFTLNEAGFWGLLSIAFIVLSLYPSMLDPVVETLNIARTLDLLIVLGFMFMIAAIFHVYSVARRSDRRIEQLVRRIAIENVAGPKKKAK